MPKQPVIDKERKRGDYVMFTDKLIWVILLVLLQIGFINRTPRGRVVTEKAYKHLKINYDQKLF